MSDFAKLAIKAVLIPALAFLLLPLAPVFAATIEVDEAAGCTLSQAIRSANGEDTGIGSCSNSDDDQDTIILSSDITLSAVLTAITSNVIIQGNGHRLTGSGSSRVIDVVEGSGESAELTINNLTITGGATSTGAGLYLLSGSLNLNNVVVTGNAASHNGGGIYVNDGALRIANSAISNNSAGWSGGAIYVYQGNVTITNSAITGNTAVYYGGGVYAAVEWGTVNITNTTFARNTADSQGGAVYVKGASVTSNLTHVTISENGKSAAITGGLQIHSGTTVNLRNSLLYGNTGNDCNGALAQDSGNLIGTGNCSATALTTNPRLGSLMTSSPAYFPLPKGSAAIDKAVSPCATTDQRGISRSQGAGCDIGAYEYAPSAATGVTSKSATASSDEARMAPMPTTCLSLLPSIIVSGPTVTRGTECQRIDAAGIGIAQIVNAGFIDAVDVWSYLGAGVQICFRDHSSGSFLFLDAANAPRTPSSLTTYSVADMVCTFIERAGSVILMPSPAPPPLSVAASHQVALENCHVTTHDMLNFRQGPGERVIDILPAGATLTALARAADWFKVDYNGATGWISAAYVTAQGDCGWATAGLS